MSTGNRVTADREGAAVAGERTARARESDAADYLVGPDSDVAPTLSVVMPTLNEEDGIADCIRMVERALEELGVTGEIIVSDSSTDRTPEIAREMGARVVVPDREGYGYAYRYAFARARGDYVAMGDADTTYDFEELPKLYRAVAEDGADMAMGSRLEGEIKPGAMPALHRYVGNPLLTRFLNAFYDVDVSDAHSGMRVLSRDALDRLELTSDGMEFASEMVMEAGARGLEIVELPITYHEREGEATLDSFADGWRHVKFMLINAPGYLFSGPGLALVTLGVLTMAVSLAGVTLGGVTFGVHTMLAGGLATVAGYQAATLAVFSAVAADPIREPSDPFTRWVQSNFRLEHGATLGVGLCVAGVGGIAFLAVEWLRSGPPSVTAHVLAFTLFVLGLQTVFNSFFLSMLGSAAESDGVTVPEVEPSGPVEDEPIAPRE